MIPYQLKLRSFSKKADSMSIQSVEYTNSRKKPSSTHQKLTHGKQKYNEIKGSHSKGC